MANTYPYPYKGIQAVPRSLKQPELMGFRYYDSLPIATTPGTTSYKFFNDTTGKNYSRTNMRQGGFLNMKETFEIRAISAYWRPRLMQMSAMIASTTTVALCCSNKAIMEDASWVIKIGDKDYNIGTLSEILTDTGNIFMFMTTAADNLFIHQGAPHYKVSGLYPLDVPVTIEGGTSFYVEVIWNTAVIAATASTLFLYVELFGRRQRPSVG